jgi:hypothetical protein
MEKRSVTVACAGDKNSPSAELAGRGSKNRRKSNPEGDTISGNRAVLSGYSGLFNLTKSRRARLNVYPYYSSQ